MWAFVCVNIWRRLRILVSLLSMGEKNATCFGHLQHHRSMETWTRGSSGLICLRSHWKIGWSGCRYSSRLLRLRKHKRGSLNAISSLDPRSLARASPWLGLSSIRRREDNLPFVSVRSLAKLNSHKQLLQLSLYLDVKCYSLISHPQHPHPFLLKGYRLQRWWWWWEWLSGICCRCLTLPSSSSSSSKARLTALQRAVSHWGIAICVRDKDGVEGGTDWQNGKCKHRGPQGILSFDDSFFFFLLLHFALAGGWWRLISLFSLNFVILPFLPVKPSAPKKKPNCIPLSNHSCHLCPVGNCCPIHKSW